MTLPAALPTSAGVVPVSSQSPDAQAELGGEATGDETLAFDLLLAGQGTGAPAPAPLPSPCPVGPGWPSFCGSAPLTPLPLVATASVQDQPAAATLDAGAEAPIQIAPAPTMEPGLAGKRMAQPLGDATSEAPEIAAPTTPAQGSLVTPEASELNPPAMAEPKADDGGGPETAEVASGSTPNAPNPEPAGAAGPISASALPVVPSQLPAEAKSAAVQPPSQSVAQNERRGPTVAEPASPTPRAASPTPSAVGPSVAVAEAPADPGLDLEPRAASSAPAAPNPSTPAATSSSVPGKIDPVIPANPAPTPAAVVASTEAQRFLRSAEPVNIGLRGRSNPVGTAVAKDGRDVSTTPFPASAMPFGTANPGVRASALPPVEPAAAVPTVREAIEPANASPFERGMDAIAPLAPVAGEAETTARPDASGPALLRPTPNVTPTLHLLQAALTEARQEATRPGRLEIDLPVEGGSTVRVGLRLQGDEVRAVFRTDSGELRAALEQAWPQFSHRLQERGVSVAEARFEGGANQQQSPSGSGQQQQSHSDAQRMPREGGAPAPFASRPVTTHLAPSPTRPAPERAGAGLSLWA